VLVLLSVLATGCATSRSHVEFCAVLQYAGALGEPYGLVRLAPELDADLRALLPAERSSDYICWYATGTEILAAYRHDGTANYGTVFRRVSGGWELSDEPPRILELPNAGF